MFIEKIEGVRRVILVDDSKADRIAVKRSLRRFSHQDIEFLELERASDVLAREDLAQYDCMTLDLHLRDLNGIELLEALRKRDGELVLPIVIITGSDKQDLGFECLQAGAHDYIYKERLAEPTLWRSICYARSRFEISRELHHRTSELERINEELKRKNRLKMEFLASATHELRTPISGIVGLLSLMLQEDLSQATRDYADRIYGCCDALSHAINDVLDLSKIEAGEFRLSEEHFCPEKVLDDTLCTLRASSKGETLHFKLEVGDVPDCVVGDSKRIRQILLNFGSNALKFTSEGTITFGATRVEGTEEILFEVADTGCGIPEDEIQHVFSRHFQASNSHEVASERGTGLGLSIVKELVTQMGGNAGCYSKLGEGSCFWFRIPLPEVESHLCDLSDDGSSGEPPLRRRRILVAEDNAILAQVVAKQLEGLGQEVTVAKDGRQALGIFEPGSFDLLLLDARMPRLGGLDVCRSIRTRYPSWKGPIYILTADATIPASDWDRLGVTSVYMKPLSLDDMKERILRV